MTTEELISLSGQYVMNTYRRFPLVLVRGAGVRVWDSDGREYLDMAGGIAVCSLGHAHPKVTAAIQEQAAKLLLMSDEVTPRCPVTLMKLHRDSTVIISRELAEKLNYAG